MDFHAGIDGDKIDINDIHLNNQLVEFPAGDYPFSLGYARIIKDETDTLIAYDKDGFHNEYSPYVLSRLINVDAANLTPENFVAGAASINYGFQRNGAILGINKEADGDVRYDVRIWGGTPSENVNVRLTDKQAKLIGELTFTAANWENAQSISVPEASGSPINPAEVNLAITSNDFNYQGSGLALSYSDTQAFAQRLPLSQIDLPAFKVGEEKREILLRSNTSLYSKQIPDQLLLTEIGGDGVTTNARSEILDSNTLKLVLGSDSQNWTGEKEFSVIDVNGSNNIDSLSFRVKAKQSQDYVASISGNSLAIKEGSGESDQILKAAIDVDTEALSDLNIHWYVEGYGTDAATKGDFKENQMPSGTVTIAKGTSHAEIDIPIKSDLLVERNEDFKIILTADNSDNIRISDQEPIFTITNDDLSSVSGTIKYWKDDTPLDQVKLNLSEDSISLSRDGSIKINNIHRDSSNQILTAELWAYANEANTFSNIDFRFNKNGDVDMSIELNQDLFDSNWLPFIEDNDQTFTFSAISLTAAETPSKIATISTSLEDSEKDMAFLEYGRVGDTTLHETHLGTSKNFDLLNGSFELSSTDGNYNAVLTKDPLTGIEQRSIDSKDALLALQMSSGSITKDDLDHQAQWIAADVDKNGTVQAKDAWLINRYAVSRYASDSSIGNWEFIKQDTSLEELGRSSSTMPDNSKVESISIGANSQELNLTAILRGDIDGSYVDHI